MSLKLKCLLFLGLVSASSAALGMDGTVSVDYSKNFVPADPYMNIGLSLSQPLSRYTTVFFTQNFEKNLVIDAETRELEASDSRIGIGRRMLTPIKDMNWKFSATASLPLSKNSQHNDVITRLGASAGLDYSADFHAGATLRIDYQFNKFQSTPGDSGDGGLPLYHYGYGANVEVAKTFWDILTPSLSGSYRETRYEDIDYIGSGVPKIDYSPDQAYSVDLGLSAALWSKAELGLTLSQGRLLEQAGWSDYVVFDKTESTWTLSFSQSF